MNSIQLGMMSTRLLMPLSMFQQRKLLSLQSGLWWRNTTPQYNLNTLLPMLLSKSQHCKLLSLQLDPWWRNTTPLCMHHIL